MSHSNRTRVEAIQAMMREYASRKQHLRDLLLRDGMSRARVTPMGLHTLEKHCKERGLIPSRPKRGQKQAVAALLKPGGDDAA